MCYNLCSVYADWDIMNSGNKVEEPFYSSAITFDIDSNYFASIGLLSDLAYELCFR